MPWYAAARLDSGRAGPNAEGTPGMQWKLGLSFMAVAGLVIGVTLWAPELAPAPWDKVITIFAALLVAMVAAWGLSSMLTRPIRGLAGTASVISQGDLTRTAIVDSRDEVGDLARSFNLMVSSLLNIVMEVRSTSEQIFESAQALSSTSAEVNVTTGEIAHAAQRIALGAEEQADMIQQTSTIVHEMAESISEVAAGAQAAFRSASEAGARAKTGREFAARATAQIEEVADRIQAAAETVAGFKERALQINKTVDFISRVAQQTHMLALNAAIEASRAGDEGRGFAVIAEEVRQLADTARGFAEQISDLAEQINTQAGEVITAMQASRRASSEGRQIVASAATSLDSIAESVLAAVGRVREISEVTNRQAEGAEGLVRAIEEISRIAGDNRSGTQAASSATAQQTASMSELSGSAQNLARTSDRLKELISIFKVR